MLLDRARHPGTSTTLPQVLLGFLAMFLDHVADPAAQ